MPARRHLCAAITILGCIAAIAWLWNTAVPGRHPFGDGMLMFGSLYSLLKSALLVLTIFTALISLDLDFTDHCGEYHALLLMSTAGMMFLVSSENLLMVFISLELLSLSLYILTAFNKRNPNSAEAALKYFLFGGMSAAFMLFGLSLVYGLTGEIMLTKVATALKANNLDPLLLTALLMVLAGFGFKIAAAPFHLWAPDAYQGAPIPSAALIASGSKVASFFILAQVLILGFGGVEGSAALNSYGRGWVPMLATLAAISMIVGNLAAIAQTSVRRLLAYSAVAQAGYILLGIIAEGAGVPERQGVAALLYYVLTYAPSLIGAFAVVALVEEKGGNDSLSAFAGLARRRPVISFCMLIFMLSLAGIPPLAGFFGKFYLFASALRTPGRLPLLWLVILAIALSAVSLYYYLQVLKQIYVREAAENAGPMSITKLTQAAIILLAAAVVVLGCAPSLLLDPLHRVLKSALPMP